ncbi:hypothetical protein EON65_36855 [archaeon]|nr:MAG: hypothetical protein EON65_36855 [archaeon]
MDSSQPLQQGYLQFAQSGECRKVFARVNQNSITLLSDDPTKVADAHLIASFDLHKTNLIEQGDFQRPKSFGLLVSGTGLVEFSCPTNSVRSAWIKTIQQAILFGNKFSVTKSLSLDIPSPDSNILMRTPMSYNPANSMPYSHSNAASCAQRLADSRATASQILQHPSHYPMACPSSSVANMSRNTSPVRLQNVPHSTLGQQQPQQNAQQQQQQQPLKFRSRAAAVATSKATCVNCFFTLA